MTLTGVRPPPTQQNGRPAGGPVTQGIPGGVQRPGFQMAAPAASAGGAYSGPPSGTSGGPPRGVLSLMFTILSTATHGEVRLLASEFAC